MPPFVLVREESLVTEDPTSDSEGPRDDVSRVGELSSWPLRYWTDQVREGCHEGSL
jgi:hypothetical protein